jgi:GntR family transcriptional regulator
MATSRLKPGDQLPTVRQLAVELKINANTVARVYADLERNGVIETRRGVGSFVAATGDQARSKRDHHKLLRSFVTRVLADGATHGFTAEEIINALSSHQSGGL